ncbi:MAG TPA: amidohydrolase [Chloroflexota bacterium]|jgi:aminobenzoyl-glutamate utilization protein B
MAAVLTDRLQSAKEQAIRSVDQERKLFAEVNRRIWHLAEPSLLEHESAERLARLLEENGFRVTRGVADMPTAFVAEWGSGDPVVGILAEYDALPSLSQKAQTEREELVLGAHGHGCGHSVFGTACAFGGIAAKQAMESAGIAGRLRVYGCPAEELLVGKVYMARAGLFDDLDAAISWHPADKTRVSLGCSKAMVSVRYSFAGVAAHASTSPHRGRSALDAVELMNVGVNYMREHIKEDARIHYVITDGGIQPNVVPPKASVWYYVRADAHGDVEEYLAWVDQIAEAAAKMSQTRLVERKLDTDCHELVPNRAIGEAIDRNLRLVGPPGFDEAERTFAARIRTTILDAKPGPALSDEIQSIEEKKTSGGSTDVGDVSWLVPTEQFVATTHANGCPGHSWQITACTGTTIGEKGGAVAAKTLACTALELLGDQNLRERAKAEFRERRGDAPYTLLIPTDQKPPIPGQGGR